MFRLTPAQITPVVICLLMTLATVAFADDPPPIEPGEWVRATVADTTEGKVKSKEVKGTLVSLDSTTVTIESSEVDDLVEVPQGDFSAADYLIEIPRENITNLEIRVQKSKKSKGALIGLGAGAALGVMSGLASGDDPDDQWFGMSSETKALWGAVVWGAIGAIIGSAVSPGDQWQEIPEDKVQLGFGLSPVGGGSIFLTRRF